MLYLENYKWELNHFKICVSYVNVSKYGTGKFQDFIYNLFYGQLKCLHC